MGAPSGVVALGHPTRVHPIIHALAAPHGHDDLVQELVLRPLGMTATTFASERMPAGAIALPHEGNGGLTPITNCHIDGALAHASAGYGLVVTTGHYPGHRAQHHGGMTLSDNCAFDLLPDARSGVVFPTNASQEAPLMELVTFLHNHLPGLPGQTSTTVDPLPRLTPATSALNICYTK